MAVPEILVPDQQVSRLNEILEIRIVGLHRKACEFVRILDLDVFHADDLVDVKIDFLELEGNPALEVFQRHALPQRYFRGSVMTPSMADAATAAAFMM